MADEKEIIIVDDDKDLLDMLVFSFEAEGFKVKGFSSGTEVLGYLKEPKNLENICLMILDRLLPDMDGLDIMRKIDPALAKHIPVLFLSVLSSEKDILSGMRQGAIDYVPKPFSLQVLISKALALINRGD